METVSVIIPNKNRSELLKEALNSVMEQSMPVYEVIVADSNSYDDSVAVVKSFPGTMVIEDNFLNQSIARNTAIKTAKGIYMAFLDSDDLWSETKIEEQLAFMLQHPDYSFSYTDALVMDMAGVEKPHSYVYYYQNENLYQGDISEKLLKGYNIIPTSSVMVRRDLFMEVGGFDENLSYHEDRDLWIRLARKGLVGFIDKKLSTYRVHSGQFSSQNQKLRQEQWRIVQKKYGIL